MPFGCVRYVLGILLIENGTSLELNGSAKYYILLSCMTDMLVIIIK